MSFFQPGDEVVLRYITRFGSGIGMSWPFRVVRDDAEISALFIPTGATYMQWSTPGGGARELVEARWRRDVLRLMYPGKPYSIWLFWEGEPRAFTTYYVNFEEPFRRTPVGFDTNDHTLDILIAPDFTWKWKDEEDFAALIASGNFSEEFGREVRDSAQEVRGMLERRESPFSDGWESWEAPLEWEAPTLHPRWKDEPAQPWERRHWAYPQANRPR